MAGSGLFVMGPSECPKCHKMSFFPEAPVPDTPSLIWACTKCGHRVEIEGKEE